LQSLTLNCFILYRQTKISNTICLDETTIHVDTILYLSLYYLVNDLVHLPNLIINRPCWKLVCHLYVYITLKVCDGRMRRNFVVIYQS